MNVNLFIYSFYFILAFNSSNLTRTLEHEIQCSILIFKFRILKHEIFIREILFKKSNIRLILFDKFFEQKNKLRRRHIIDSFDMRILSSKIIF